MTEVRTVVLENSDLAANNKYGYTLDTNQQEVAEKLIKGTWNEVKNNII